MLISTAPAHVLLNPSVDLVPALRPDPEDLIVWADGTSCLRDELQQMGHMSDDYEEVHFGSSRYIAMTADRLYFEMELVYLAQSPAGHVPTYLVATLDIPTIERILQLRHQAIAEDLSSIAVPHSFKLAFKLEEELLNVHRVVVDTPLVQYMGALCTSGIEAEVPDDAVLVVTKNSFWFAGTWHGHGVSHLVSSAATPITHEYFSEAVGQAEISVEVLTEFLLNEDVRRCSKPVAGAAALAAAQTECGQRCGQCNQVMGSLPGQEENRCAWCAMPVFMTQ